MESKNTFIAGMAMTEEQKALAQLDRIHATLDAIPNKPKKKKKTAVYNFTLEQIEELKRKTVKDAVKTLIELTLGLPVMVLHDKHGWGKVRNERFVDEVMKLYSAYEEGYLTLEDVRDALQEEAGVRIKKQDEGLLKQNGGKR